MKKRKSTTKKCDGPHPLVALFFIMGFIYIIAMAININNRYNCDSYVRYRIDYIFPARAISCFLYEEVND